MNYSLFIRIFSTLKLLLLKMPTPLVINGQHSAYPPSPHSQQWSAFWSSWSFSQWAGSNSLDRIVRGLYFWIINFGNSIGQLCPLSSHQSISFLAWHPWTNNLLGKNIGVSIFQWANFPHQYFLGAQLVEAQFAGAQFVAKNNSGDQSARAQFVSK